MMRVPVKAQSRNAISIHLKALGNWDYRERALACSRQEALIRADSAVQIGVGGAEVCVRQEEGESDHYPLVIGAAQP